MKRVVVILMLMLVAFIGSAEGFEKFGGWTVFEYEETLLDPAFKVAGLDGVNDSLVGIRLEPTPRVIVVFPEFIASEGESHDDPVLFVTDKMEALELPDRGFRPDSNTLLWEGQAALDLIEGIVKAEVIMFRTYTYRSNSVDAMFETSPEMTGLALEELRK